MPSEIWHKIDQVIFNWELLVTDNARSFQSFPLFIRCNVECTWIIVGRVDRLEALISIIADTYMSFYKKWKIIKEIFDSWKIQNVNIFHFWKNSSKKGQIFQLFTLSLRGPHFSIRMLDHLISCNIHLEMDFLNLSWKRIAFS